ncbi:hypothetical protein Bxe_C0139 [Paraburkholderia xenovorans LB400]|uniref:Uncharacterized protein n=1 Tax=Paraburkholderia xenovorans (strain LB400) TaxID=266265 RepID=Q13IM5_PARXL|nr:hypothetical protein Bxe_C0139 [Paraburkholderia xenovorans LB400]
MCGWPCCCNAHDKTAAAPTEPMVPHMQSRPRTKDPPSHRLAASRNAHVGQIAVKTVGRGPVTVHAPANQRDLLQPDRRTSASPVSALRSPE